MKSRKKGGRCLLVKYGNLSSRTHACQLREASLALSPEDVGYNIVQNV